MKIGFELWVALRYLKVRSRELFISLITWISIAGVAVGVATLIVVLAVMTGFEQDLRDKILGSAPHVRIEAQEGSIDGWRPLVEEIETDPALGGVLSVSPVVDAKVMFMAKERVQGVELTGIDVSREGLKPTISASLVEGDVTRLRGDRPGVFIGSEMADNWGLGVGDRVKLISPEASMTPVGPVPRFRVFRVAGIFFTGMYQKDTSTVFVALDVAREFFRMGDSASAVELRLEDIYAAPLVAERLGETLGDGYRVRDWTQMNASLFGAMQLEKIAMMLILGLIVLVAAFNIASTLIMVVMEKARDIGVLKSMGADSAKVRRIFIFEGAVIGLVGTVLGVGAGLALALALEKFEFLRLPQDVYYINTIPVVLEPGLIALVSLGAVSVCLLATFYPAWQASRLDPIETIRYE